MAFRLPICCTWALRLVSSWIRTKNAAQVVVGALSTFRKYGSRSAPQALRHGLTRLRKRSYAFTTDYALDSGYAGLLGGELDAARLGFLC